jgi:hypothetical protein
VQDVSTTKESNNSKKGRREEENARDEGEADFADEWKNQLPQGEHGRAIRNFVAIWNGTEGTQPIRRPADLGNLAELLFLLDDPAWKINHLRALQKFPLPFFPEGMHVLKFLKRGTVQTALAGGYDHVPRDKLDAAKHKAEVVDIHEGLEDIFGENG